jgi:hypothetical protein
MRTGLLTAFAVCAAASFAAATASANNSVTTTTLRANLTINHEIPKPAHASPAAKGAFSATLSGDELKWTLTFTGLTGPVTATYLHFGTKSQTGTVLTAICAPCKSPATGRVKLSSVDINDVTAGKTYINVDTFKNPRGEIRGQVS